MSEHEQSTRPPVVTPARIIAAICIAAPFVAVLYVPIYDRDKPEVAGFPFFFWWQLLWVAVTAGLMGLAYYVVRREDLARKAAAAGGTAAAAEPQKSEEPAAGSGTDETDTGKTDSGDTDTGNESGTATTDGEGDAQ